MEYWLWSTGYGVLAMEYWPWCTGYGVLAMVYWLWSTGHGVLAMVYWLWCSHSSLLSGTESEEKFEQIFMVTTGSQEAGVLRGQMVNINISDI